MLLKVFEKHWKKHPIKSSFFAGLVYSLIAFGFSSFLFKNQPHLVGITTVFFIVLFAFPLFSAIMKKEEYIEKTETSFFKKNHAVLDYHFYFFIGVLLVFIIISMIQPFSVFTMADFFNIDTTVRTSIDIPPPSVSNEAEFFSILTNNLFIVFVFFLLMLFFGAGGLLLIVLNASMAGGFIAQFYQDSVTHSFCQFSLFSIHFFPEMFGFLLAAIAGGLFVVDIVKEKFLSKSFNKVAIDSILFFILAMSLVVVGALLEVYVTKPLFFSDICVTSSWIPISIFFLIIGSIFFLETHRQKRKKHYVKK